MKKLHGRKLGVPRERHSLIEELSFVAMMSPEYATSEIGCECPAFSPWASLRPETALSNRKPYALTLDGTDIIGTHNPPAKLKPRSWAHNVIKLENIPSGNYTISLSGEKEGSEGAASHFEGRFVVKGKSEVQSFAMNSVSEGSFSLTLENTLEEAYIIIASVPEQFTSAQNYGYSITISQ